MSHSEATDIPTFLTPQEVSELLRVSAQTVRRWIHDGDLPAYKIGRGWRIREEDLNLWLDRQRTEGNQHSSISTS